MTCAAPGAVRAGAHLSGAPPTPPSRKEAEGEPPDETRIFQTIKAIYSIAEFSAECLVISLLYIERLRSLTKILLLLSNWQARRRLSMLHASRQLCRPCAEALGGDPGQICEAPCGVRGGCERDLWRQ